MVQEVRFKGIEWRLLADQQEAVSPQYSLIYRFNFRDTNYTRQEEEEQYLDTV